MVCFLAVAEKILNRQPRARLGGACHTFTAEVGSVGVTWLLGLGWLEGFSCDSQVDSLPIFL